MRTTELDTLGSPIDEPLQQVTDPVTRLLAIERDGTVGSTVVGIMCSSPKPAQFAALGRLLRAADRDDLAEMLGRKPRGKIR